MLRLDDLQYKGLKIFQDTGEFCFGTDSVLLAGFASVRRGDRIADLCSGTGLVALLVTARCEPSSCLAAELQPHMAELCAKNVAYNAMEDIITVRCADIRKMGFGAEAGSMDAVVCNPPYMKPDGSLAGEKQSVRIARQEIECTLEDAVSAAARLLRFGGRFAMVHQCERIADIIVAMRASGMEPKRLRLVQPRADKPPRMILAEGVRGGRPGSVWEPTLVLNTQDGGYTEELKRIYHMQI